MKHSSASAVQLLPFGSLTGFYPLDAIQRGRVLGDFSTVLGCDRLAGISHAIPWSVEPVAVVQRDRRPSSRGGAAVSD